MPEPSAPSNVSPLRRPDPDALADRAAAIQTALELLIPRGALAELCALDGPGAPTRGYFRDRAKMAREAAALHGKYGGVYFCLNPLRPELAARAEETVSKYGKERARDPDVMRRTLLFIDFDPVRPVAGIPATDEEHAAAIALAHEVRDALAAEGWPAPALVDSGNGAALLYRVKLRADAKSDALVRGVLDALALRFDTETARVDKTVGNRARLARVPYTLNKKGTGNAERPHREASIIDAPAKLETVPAKLLKALAAQVPPKAPPGVTPAADAAAPGVLFDALAAEYKLGIKQVVPGRDGDTFHRLTCLHDPAHRGGAFIVAPDGRAKDFLCFKASCKASAASGRPQRERLRDALLALGGDALAARLGAAGDAGAAHPYVVEGARTFLTKATPDGHALRVPLADFAARIVAERILDDGQEQAAAFLLEGTLPGGEVLPGLTVTAMQFGAMNWPNQWGARASLRAGMGTRDHARAAIQLMSENVRRERVHVATGWRREGDRWIYIHGAGAIDADGTVPGVAVELASGLAGFGLPDPPTGAALKSAVRASLALERVAPDRVSLPLLAATVRAAIAASDFTVGLFGTTGIGKSELAALAQQHYGPTLGARNLASWSSTANALEGRAFALADTLLVIDDLHFTGSATDRARMQRDADRIIRGAGNQQGRARMRADGSLPPPRPPRGTLLVTGEDLPGGASLLARLLAIDMRAGDENETAVSAAMLAAAEGKLAAAAAGFVRWLAPRLDAMRERVRATERTWWTTHKFTHARTGSMLGSLAAGHAAFRDFAVEAGALSQAQADALGARVEAALLAVGEAQAAHQRSEDPVRRFLALLTGALASGEAHVCDADGPGPPRTVEERKQQAAAPQMAVRAPRWGWPAGAPEGTRVGWLRDGADLYLEPEATYKAVQQFASAQSTSLGLAQSTLWKRLAERGLLQAADADHHTRKVRLGDGRRQRVLHLRAGALEAEPGDAAPAAATKTKRRGPKP